MDEQLSAPVVNPAIHGKPRLRRKRSTELMWKVDTTRGRQRFRVEGVYVDGKRTRRYFRAQREAETFIEAEQIRRANLGSRAQSIDRRLFEDAVEAERLLAAEGLPVMAAVREYLAAHSILRPFPGASLSDAARHYAKLVGDRQRSWTVDEAAEAWIESRVAKGCSRFYLVDASRRLQRFRDTFGTISMTDVSDTAIEEWVAGLGLGPQSQRNFLTVISGLFGSAVTKGKAPANPCERIERPTVVADESGILTPAELRRLLAHLPVDTVPYVVIGAFAGLRPQERRRESPSCCPRFSHSGRVSLSKCCKRKSTSFTQTQRSGRHGTDGQNGKHSTRSSTVSSALCMVRSSDRSRKSAALVENRRYEAAHSHFRAAISAGNLIVYEARPLTIEFSDLVWSPLFLPPRAPASSPLFDPSEYVPTDRGQSDHLLFQMARRLKRWEREAGWDSSAAQREGVLHRWWDAAQGAVDPSKGRLEYLAKFLYACDAARQADDESFLDLAWREAELGQLPAEAARFADAAWMPKLVAFCFQLQKLRGAAPFFLSCRDAAERLGEPHTSVFLELNLLCKGAEPLLRKVSRGSLASRTSNESLPSARGSRPLGPRGGELRTKPSL